MTTKPTNLTPQYSRKSTAHSQAAELAQAAGAGKVAQTVLTSGANAAMQQMQEELTAEKAAHAVTTGSLVEAQGQITALTAELEAEKEAHAKASAALAAATATT